MKSCLKFEPATPRLCSEHFTTMTLGRNTSLKIKLRPKRTGTYIIRILWIFEDIATAHRTAHILEFLEMFRIYCRYIGCASMGVTRKTARRYKTEQALCCEACALSNISIFNFYVCTHLCVKHTQRTCS